MVNWHKKNQKNLWKIYGIFSITTACFVTVVFLLIQNPISKTAKASNFDANEVIQKINLERKKNNLPDLQSNSKLSLASVQKAKDIIDQNYFAHINPSNNKKWSDFIFDNDYNYIIAGENLAKDFYDVEDLVKAWMNSPTHRENILNIDVKDTGVGVIKGKLNNQDTVVVVQEFGKVVE